ncbi:hypothetical protein IVG45_13755 [Methylomonas sp. LL1]|uniref:hypothetical protein n=1 Tax=Methylomonas sp. LL1 TaxID=2785785 RepID=UPI0018C41062|nr:hypothetical protein [Methylomonas sp. LL1]QPK61924.1 hypothetical protein IVG45_13755 [Methylomonas sp. LL1]
MTPSEANADNSTGARSFDSEITSTQPDVPESGAKANKTGTLPAPSAGGQFVSGQNMPQLMRSSANDPARGVMVGDPELGFHAAGHQAGQSPFANALFDQLHDEARLMVGEEIYAKMVWTYSDIKELDNWIYSSMSQYDLLADQSQAGAKAVSGLNQQLTAELVFLGLKGSDGPVLAGKGSTNVVNLESRRSMPGYAEPMLVSDSESQNAFLFILKYLTIANFLYLMVSVMAAVSLAKAFNFFIRQER